MCLSGAHQTQFFQNKNQHGSEISPTCPVVVCVVIRHVIVEDLDPTSSHIPVYIGVPLVTVST